MKERADSRSARDELEALFNFEGANLQGENVPDWHFLLENGGVAQLGEHLPCKQGVDSSNLFISTKGETPKKSTLKTEQEERKRQR